MRESHPPAQHQAAAPNGQKARKKTERTSNGSAAGSTIPFLWKAWMLMGRSQFFKGDFESGSYHLRLHEPPLRHPTCHLRQGSRLAGQMLHRTGMDVRCRRCNPQHTGAIPSTGVPRRNGIIPLPITISAQGEPEKAIPYLRKVISHEMRRKQKAREWYLMGTVAGFHRQQAGGLQGFQARGAPQSSLRTGV